MIKTRTARKEDVNFIFDSWLKSWRKSKYAGVIPNNLYYSTYRSTIENLVARGAELTVACPENNDDHILGWICHEKTSDSFAVIHYLYVKDPFMKQGIDGLLLDCVGGSKPGFYTFNYAQVANVCRKDGWRWTPEIARRK